MPIVTTEQFETEISKLQDQIDLMSDDISFIKNSLSERDLKINNFEEEMSQSKGFNVPKNVNSNANEGFSNIMSRSDHKHKGVESVNVSGSAQLYGQIIFKGSGSTTVSQSGQVITISS